MLREAENYVTSIIKCFFLIPFTPAEAFIALLGAVLRSVEALLCRFTGEAWQNQDLPVPPYCHAGPHNARECEQQAGLTQPGDTNMCFTQVLQWHLFCLLRILELLGRDNVLCKISSTVFINEYDQSRSASP